MIPETIQRFILTSVDSIPHLEAILLLRYDPQKEWNAKMVAQSLFINEKQAETILDNLCSSQIASHHAGFYRYDPVPIGLKEKIDEMAHIYAKNLIEVTNLVHSKTLKQAQQFGDAFKWDQGKD